jgi:hypothetical protein
VKFTSYAVVPLRDLGEHCESCKPHEAEFWGLFGETDTEVYAIGDFANKSDAEFIKDALEASSG